MEREEIFSALQEIFEGLFGEGVPTLTDETTAQEFCADDFPVYMSGGNGTYRMLRLSRLLPASFRAEEQLL